MKITDEGFGIWKIRAGNELELQQMQVIVDYLQTVFCKTLPTYWSEPSSPTATHVESRSIDHRKVPSG